MIHLAPCAFVVNDLQFLHAKHCVVHLEAISGVELNSLLNPDQLDQGLHHQSFPQPWRQLSSAPCWQLLSLSCAAQQHFSQRELHMSSTLQVSHTWNMGLYARESVPSSFVSSHVALQCAPPLPWPACLSFPAVSTGTDIQVYIQVVSKRHCVLPTYLVFSFCCTCNCFFFYSLLSHNFTPPCLPQIG